MESLSDFYHRRRRADEKSAADLDWTMRMTELELTAKAASAEPAGGAATAPVQRPWNAPPTIWFYDASAVGHACPGETTTPFTQDFARASTTRIGYLADLPNPLWGRMDGTVALGIVVYLNGRLIERRQYPFAAYGTRTRLRPYNPMGRGVPGGWWRGEYVLDFYVGNQPVVRGGFRVT